MTIGIGCTIKLFLIDGVADGMVTAEIMNWTGHVLYAPRSRIVGLIQRSEVKKTGVYILVGKDIGDPNATLVYVGEGDNVASRLTSHDGDEQKDFWEFACVITSKDLNLTKAHVRYLESRLIQLIASEGRARLANKTNPNFDLLPEADKSDMEEFITRIQVLLPVLGLQFVRPTPEIDAISKMEFSGESQNQLVIPQNDGHLRATFPQVRPSIDGNSSPIFSFKVKNIVAKAVEVGGQMIVLAQSRASEATQPSLASNVATLRNELQRSKKLIPSAQKGELEFVVNVPFPSPSAAAQAIAGTSRNGRADWVTEDQKTYANWQESQINLSRSEAVSGASANDLL